MRNCGVASLLFSAALAIPLSTFAQVPGPPNSPPGPAPPPPADRPVSWKQLLPNILGDQKKIWTFPAGLVQGRGLVPTAAVLGTTAGLVALDPTEAPYFRGTSAFHGFNHIFAGKVTAIGTIAAPISLYTAGLIRKDSKMQHTALLAGEALADSEIFATFLKGTTRRLRPEAVTSNYWDTWFDHHGSILHGNGSFPSGHTIAAFSVATIISRSYGRKHRWVPYASYSAAALVGFSRLSLSSHFLSDVFMGSALGYSISRFAVLRQ